MKHDIFGNSKLTTELKAPTAYQGGKQRIAKNIIDFIFPDKTNIADQKFDDRYCGSGAVSIAAVNAGIRPENITMVDGGPWGMFWSAIGRGEFDLDKFRSICDQIPSSPQLIQAYMKELSSLPVDENAVYNYLLLQASSFGGKAIWISDGKWMNTSFRSYWQPTATSNRRSHVNPMMPMPDTLFERVEVISKAMLGVNGYCSDVKDIKVESDALVYADPPYDDTTGYGFNSNLNWFISLPNRKFISEGKPLSEKSIMISGSRKKGGISGNRNSSFEEWLSEL